MGYVVVQMTRDAAANGVLSTLTLRVLVLLGGSIPPSKQLRFKRRIGRPHISTYCLREYVVKFIYA